MCTLRACLGAKGSGTRLSARTVLFVLFAVGTILAGGCPRSGPDWRPLLLRSRGRALVLAYGESLRPDPTVLRSGEDYLELSLERVVLRPPPGWSGKAVVAALEVNGLLPDGRPVRTLAALTRAGSTEPHGRSSRIGAVPYRGTNINITLHLRDLDPPESAHILGRLESTRALIQRLDPSDPEALSAAAAQFAAAVGSGSRRRMWTYSFSLLAPGAATAEDMPVSATHYVLVLSPGTERGVLPAPAPLAWRSSAGPGLQWPNGRPFKGASYLVLRIQRRRRLGLPTRAGRLLAEAQNLLTQGVLGPVAGRLHQLVAAIGASTGLTEREKSLETARVELLRIRLAAAQARDRNDTGLRVRKLAAEIAGLAQHRSGFADLLLTEEVARLHRRVATIARWARAARSEHRTNVDDIQVALREYRRGLAPGPRDEIPEAAPVLAGTVPPSPTSRTLRPVVRGQAAAGARISFYADPDCRGSVAGSATAAADGSFSRPIPAARDAVTRFSAQVRDYKGNLSACSSPLVFVHDGTPPEVPTLSGTEPRSPSRTQVAALVVGRAEPGASLRVFRDSACRDEPLASASVDRQGAFRVPVAVAPNTRSLFWAAAMDAAGNTSRCTGPVPYEHDDRPPGAPVLVATEPASPSAVTASPTPTVVGLAEAGTMVRLFAAAECAGPQVAQSLASPEGAFRMQVGARAQATTSFSAMAIDAAGNRSTCSSALTFVHDAIPPEPPRLTEAFPAPPGRTTTQPAIIGAAEPGATVRLFAASPCTGEPAGVGLANPTGTFRVTVAVAPNAATSIYASATDAAGNTSKCSSGFPYLHDDRPPPAPLLVASSPRSPSRLTAHPTVEGTAESGARVELYADARCSGTPAAKGRADGNGRFSIQVALQENRRTLLWATAADAAGNRSSCSGSLSFEHDSVPPSPPSLLGTRPKSPSQSLHPTVFGKAEPRSAVAVYTSSTCSGKPVGRGETGRTGRFRVRVRVEMDALTNLSATATDPAGNVSQCSPDMIRYRQREPNDPPQ